MTRIIIDCESIGELDKTKNLIKLGGFKGQICVYDNEKLLEECSQYPIGSIEREQKDNGNIPMIYNILGCMVVNKFKL